tara:strand:+ start:544 stop:960 length:417 start_codon:yes stop_codon:yes gene_type:complete
MIMDMKNLMRITKERLGFKFDREIADALKLTRSGLSQKIARGDFPFYEIRQLLKNRGCDDSWLNEFETKKMRQDNSQTDLQRLQDKDQIIQIQQNYIEDLKRTIERMEKMEEEDKKKWIPRNAPEYINQPSHQTQLGT